MLKAKDCRWDGNRRPIHIHTQQPSEGEQLQYRFIPEGAYTEQARDLHLFRLNTAKAEPTIVCLPK